MILVCVDMVMLGAAAPIQPVYGDHPPAGEWTRCSHEIVNSIVQRSMSFSYREIIIIIIIILVLNLGLCWQLQAICKPLHVTRWYLYDILHFPHCMESMEVHWMCANGTGGTCRCGFLVWWRRLVYKYVTWDRDLWTWPDFCYPSTLAKLFHWNCKSLRIIHR